MSDLDNCRKDIDSIDKQLVELFEKRMDIVTQVAKYKRKNNIPILSEDREEQVIEKNLKGLKNKKYSSLLRDFFNNLMEISRKLQSKLISQGMGEENKVSIVFSLEDEAGSLCRLLRYFDEKNVNILRVESKVSENELCKYLLYVDFDGDIEDTHINQILDLIERNSAYFRVLD